MSQNSGRIVFICGIPSALYKPVCIVQTCLHCTNLSALYKPVYIVSSIWYVCQNASCTGSCWADNHKVCCMLMTTRFMDTTLTHITQSQLPSHRHTTDTCSHIQTCVCTFTTLETHWNLHVNTGTASIV